MGKSTLINRLIGEERVLIREPKFGSEDFGYFLAQCPGAGFELGCSNEKKGMTHISRNATEKLATTMGFHVLTRSLKYCRS